ncbi:hypothetical protein IU479_32715 [Nocardia abscessus]|nr:hypothetical protein [Nocardia abscessus]MBF6222849.1 hypothetical protein [Nocardia abscessus]
MGAPRKFDEETRARAVRMYQDRIREHGESMAAVVDGQPARLRDTQTGAPPAAPDTTSAATSPRGTRT